MSTDDTIDRQVAERVMGWTPDESGRFGNGRYLPHTVNPRTHRLYPAWEPSTNIAHAFEVVERMREKGYCLVLWAHHDEWRAMFTEGQSGSGDHYCDVGSMDGHIAEATTAPSAIALAALEAVKGEK